MELIEIVNLQFVLPIVIVICFALLLFLFGFRESILPPILNDDSIALRKSKSKISNKLCSKHSKKSLIDSDSGHTLDSGKSNVEISKQSKKASEKSEVDITSKTSSVSIKPRENATAEKHDAAKDNEWIVATTKKVKKERSKRKQEYNPDNGKNDVEELYEKKQNDAISNKIQMETSIKTKISDETSTNAVGLQKNEVHSVEKNDIEKLNCSNIDKNIVQRSKTLETLPVIGKVNGSVVKDQEESLEAKASKISSKTSDVSTSKSEKGDNSKKKSKKETRVENVAKDLVQPASLGDSKSKLLTLETSEGKKNVDESNYHQVNSPSQQVERQVNNSKSKASRAEKSNKSVELSHKDINEVSSDTMTNVSSQHEQQVNSQDVQAFAISSKEEVGGSDWEEIKAPKKKKKLRLD